MNSGRSTVVEHLPPHPKVVGLSLAKAAGSGRDEMAIRFLQIFP